MKATGIVRNLDNVGRLVIPKEMRNVMGISEGDPLEIVQVNNEIVVKKYRRGCVFCGSENEVAEFKDVLVCKECKKVLKED